MTVLRRDHKVRAVREETLAQTALHWRAAGGHYNHAYFNVVEFVTDVLSKRLNRSFKIRFFDMEPGADPAYVDFDPVEPPTLFIDKGVWEDANLGDPFARFVIAHEIGHLIFHDHDAKAFSNNPNDRIAFESRDEVSAEWQANTFAAYFLLPTHIVASFDDLQDLIRYCGVETQLAESRLGAVRAAQKRLIRYEGDACSKCGNFTLVRNGTCLKCNTCGSTTGADSVRALAL
jgi:hypothetical protein